MSQFEGIDIRCYICGEKVSQTHILSSGSYGPSDLDSRPDQMLRSTMHMWVRECPFCKYTAASLDQETSVDPEFLKSEEYLNCSGLNFESPVAEQFYRHYLISSQENNTAAFYAALHAAWACDDPQDVENATICRKLALAEMEKIPYFEECEENRIIKADLLRRAGMFQRVIDEFDPASFQEEEWRDAAEFEIYRAKEEDSCCYPFDSIGLLSRVEEQEKKLKPEVFELVEKDYDLIIAACESGNPGILTEILEIREIDVGDEIIRFYYKNVHEWRFSYYTGFCYGREAEVTKILTEKCEFKSSTFFPRGKGFHHMEDGTQLYVEQIKGNLYFFSCAN